jgi:hypothetical protein
MLNPAQLAEAMAEARQQRTVWPQWEPFSTLRPTPPPKRPSAPPPSPPVPVSRDVGANEAQGLAVPSKPADDVVAAPEVIAVTKRDGDRLEQPVWQALLDVSVWRSRPWWWRLAASLVVKRLGR